MPSPTLWEEAAFRKPSTRSKKSPSHCSRLVPSGHKSPHRRLKSRRFKRGRLCKVQLFLRTRRRSPPTHRPSRTRRAPEPQHCPDETTARTSADAALDTSLRGLMGVGNAASNLGNFATTTIPNGSDVREALDALPRQGRHHHGRPDRGDLRQNLGHHHFEHRAARLARA